MAKQTESAPSEGKKAHPADEFVRSAHAPVVAADEYVLPAEPPRGALVKADALTLVAVADRTGKVRLTSGSWEDARVLQPGEMLGLRREGTFWVVTKIEAKGH